MEDALTLAACLHEHPTVPEALSAYEAERKPVVESTQRAAQASLEWFEGIGGYTGQQTPQFAFNLLTRSRRVGYQNLRERDPDFVAGVDSWFGAEPGVPPMFQPFQLGRVPLRNRIVVPPLAAYTAIDGVPSAFEAAQFSAHALGGAALVLAGMTAVSARGRATPHCPGLWNDEQERAWRRIVEAARLLPGTRLGIQLTHAGRRASTARPGPDGIGRPLAPGRAAGRRWPPPRCPGTPTARARASSTGSKWTPSSGTSPPPPNAPRGPASTCWSSRWATDTCSPGSSPR